MSTHRSATPRRRRRSGRVRALLSLGAVAVLATGMSVKGTFAFWTDAATATTGSFTAGKLDITLNGQLAGASNNGGTTPITSIALTGMFPGESAAYTFPLATTADSIGVTYTVAGYVVSGALSPALRFTLHTGAAGTPQTTNGVRTGSCTGPRISAEADQTIAATSTMNSPTPLVTTAQPLAAGATQTICVLVRMDPNAGNGVQGASLVAGLTFNAKQVNAP